MSPDKFGVTYDFELLDAAGNMVDSWQVTNLVPLDGVNHLAAAMFGDTPAIGNFHVGVFAGNYLPTMDSKAADIPSAMGEFVGYSEATRPVWQRLNTDGVISNAHARAAFTLTANATLYGGLLSSSAVKGSGAGLLLSVARFPTPRPVEAGMVIRVAGELSLISTGA